MTEPTFDGTSRLVQAGGIAVHVHEAGPEGAPLVLLVHGGAPGAYGWGNFGQNMPAFSERFRTVIVDLPGYGRSDKPEIEGGRYGYYASVFADLIRVLGYEKAHVVGLATGGAALIALAADHPEVVDRLVLVSSAGGFPLFSNTPSEGGKVIGSYYAGEGPSRDKMRRYLEMIIHDKSLITDAIIDERYQASIDPAFMKNAPEGGITSTSEIVGRHAVNEPVHLRLGEIQAKTLVIWGRDNRVQGYDNALYMLNTIPDVEIHVFGHTGLWVPFERQSRFETLTLGFLQD